MDRLKDCHTLLNNLQEPISWKIILKNVYVLYEQYKVLKSIEMNGNIGTKWI